MGGRGLLALGCVVTVAVALGVVVAVVGLGTLMTPTVVRAAPTPTVGFVEPMRPIPGRIDVRGGAGVAMTAEPDGGESFFLANGTRVQILQAERPLSRVQVMDGQHQHRVGWIPTNAVST